MHISAIPGIGRHDPENAKTIAPTFVAQRPAKPTSETRRHENQIMLSTPSTPGSPGNGSFLSIVMGAVFSVASYLPQQNSYSASFFEFLFTLIQLEEITRIAWTAFLGGLVSFCVHKTASAIFSWIEKRFLPAIKRGFFRLCHLAFQFIRTLF